jgi:hypothetical protein
METDDEPDESVRTPFAAGQEARQWTDRAKPIPPEEPQPPEAGEAAPAIHNHSPSPENLRAAPDATQQTGLVTLEKLRPSTGRNDAPDHSEAISRMLAIVEEIHRATVSPRPASNPPPPDIINRLERLESWIATNRLP